MPLYVSLTVFALAAYPAVFVAVTLHEAGHALFARMAGYRVTSLGLGSGAPFFRAALPGGALFFLCRQNPSLGTCWTTTVDLLPPRPARALLLVGGALANIVAGALFLIPAHHGWGVIWLALAVMNLLLGVTNLLPLRHRVRGGSQTVASDGLQAITLFASRHARAELPHAEIGFVALWDEIGDTRTPRFRYLLAALAALPLGVDGAVSAYLREAERLPGGDEDGDAHLLYLRGRIALRAGERDAARELLAAARDAYRSLSATGSLFLCELYALYTLPTTWEALSGCETLAAHPLATRPDVATMLAATRVLLLAGNPQKGGEAAALETMLARYESARRRYRDDVEERDVYAAVAGWRETHGDAVGARVAWARAADLTREIGKTLVSEPVLRDAYRRHIEQEAARLGYASPLAGGSL